MNAVSAPAARRLAGSAMNNLRALRVFWDRRDLIAQLARREIALRTKGSLLGALWTLLTPLILLGIYSIVFGLIFPSQWPQNPEPFRLDFVVILFCNIASFELLRETWNGAADLIPRNPNYVKKVVFPLETLPAALLLANAFHTAANFAVLYAGMLALKHTIPLTALLLPLALLPLALLALAGGFLFSALGVYIRDIKQTVALLTTALFFMSPIFYSVHTVRERIPPIAPLIATANPLSHALDAILNVGVFGLALDWRAYGAVLGLSAAAAFAAFACFRRLRPGFADVM